MRYTLYISGAGWRKPNLILLNSQSDSINYNSKRKFFHGFKLLINEANLQYLGYELNGFSPILIALKNQATLFNKNPLLAISDLIYGHALIFELNSNSYLTLIAAERNSTSEFWISRSATNSGMQSKNFGQEIEWDRQRHSRKFSAFVWEFRALGLLVNKKMIKSETLEKSKLPIIRNLAINLSQNRLETNYINIKDCFLIHGTLILKDNSVFYVDENNGIEEISWPTNMIYKFKGSFLVIGGIRDFPPVISKAVFFGSSSSWFHFLVEVLPRFINYKSVDYADYTVIVRRDMPNSILQILQILGFNKVHVMYDGDQIKIKSLITIQDFRFVGSNKLNQRKDDLALVRNFLLELSDNNCGPQYIYLVRDTALFRPMHRINSFLKKLKKIGFILVNPEELSLIDQINLLRNAKIVVSESGAALTNILLLPKTCKVVEIHPMKNKAGLWGEMAAVFGIELSVIYGKPMKLKNLISGVGTYRVNQRKTILLLKALKIETENVRHL